MQILLDPITSTEGMQEDLNYPAESASQKGLIFSCYTLPELLQQASPNHHKYLSLSGIAHKYFQSRDILEA